MVKSLDVLNRLSAVDALQHRHLREPDFLRIRRIHGDGRVVPRALPDGAIARWQAPSSHRHRRIVRVRLSPLRSARRPAVSRIVRSRRRPFPTGLRAARPWSAASTCRRHRGRRADRCRARRWSGPRDIGEPARSPRRGSRDSLGSIAMSDAPVSASFFSTCCQVLPPSFVRYTPRSGFAPNGLPSTAANAMSGLVGWTAIVPIWPRCFQTCVHVLPPSTVL